MAEINIAVYSQVPIRKQIKNTNGIGKSEMSDLIKWAPNQFWNLVKLQMGENPR